MAETIVCMDGHMLNPGDLSWESFERLGPFTVHDRTSEDRILERARGAAFLLTNKTPLTADTIKALPELTYIGVLATGFNVVDVAAASARNVVVTSVPTYGTDSVAQHAAALMLAMARQICVHHEAVRGGHWSSGSDWCFALAPITELTDMTFGIVGLGKIGRAVARIGAAMGMRLVGHDLYWPSPEQLDGLEIERLEMDDVFARSDVVTLHCPLTDETQHLVNAERLKKMKPTAILINTSRGPLVDNHALAEALRQRTIAGAGLDVLDVEPPPPDNPLIGAPNCIVTPHIAWYARAARQRLLNTAAANLEAFLEGKPVNQVN